jgi:dihydrofolate reductase
MGRPLFGWFGNGDVEWKWTEEQEHPNRTTQASKDFFRDVYPRIGVVVMGRRLFDLVDGWGGVPGQALRLGLIDQVVMNVVPVVFGASRPFFGAMGPGDTVMLSNPSRVAQGDRVTHILYDVVRTSPSTN